MAHYTRYTGTTLATAHPMTATILATVLLCAPDGGLEILNTEVRCAVRKWLRVSTLALMLRDLHLLAHAAKAAHLGEARCCLARSRLRAALSARLALAVALSR